MSLKLSSLFSVGAFDKKPSNQQSDAVSSQVEKPLESDHAQSLSDAKARAVLLSRFWIA